MSLPSENNDDDRYDCSEKYEWTENGQRNDADHVEFGLWTCGFAGQRINAILCFAVFGHNVWHFVMVARVFVWHMADLFVIVRVLVVWSAVQIVVQIVAGSWRRNRVGRLSRRACRFEFVGDRLLGGGENRRWRCDRVRLFGRRGRYRYSGPDGFEFVVSRCSVLFQSGSVGGGIMGVWHRGIGRWGREEFG